MTVKKQKIRIGWASCDITPGQKTTLCCQFHTRVSKGVLDPVTATALALESADGRMRTILISIDAAFVADYTRARFDKAVRRLLPDMPVENIVIHATHTHTAPTQPCYFIFQDVPDKTVMKPAAYGQFLAQRLARLAVSAWKKRSWGAVAWGYGQAVVSYNRRAAYMDGSSVMYGATNDPMFSHMEGHENHAVDMLFTYDVRHQLTGMMLNVPCPSQCTEHLEVVSADYWHETRVELRRRFGEKLFVLPQCGAAGDLSPHLMINHAAQARMFRLKGLMKDARNFDMAQRQEIALRIAQAVADALPACAHDIRDQVELAHAYSLLQIPLRKLTPADVRACEERIGFFTQVVAEYARKKVNPFNVGHSSCIGQRGYYQHMLELHRAMVAGRVPPLPVHLHAVRIGDLAVAANQFEYLLDFAERIKARSPALQTCVAQLAGEGSYLATERAERGGGYGAWFASTALDHHGGQQIVEESLRLLAGLWR